MTFCYIQMKGSRDRLEEANNRSEKMITDMKTTLEGNLFYSILSSLSHCKINTLVFWKSEEMLLLIWNF